MLKLRGLKTVPDSCVGTMKVSKLWDSAGVAEQGSFWKLASLSDGILPVSGEIDKEGHFKTVKTGE